MSVAVGIAQPRARRRPVPSVDGDEDQRRPTMPPTAATIGSAARRGSRRSPATNSRLSSRPTTKKKIASSPSAAQAPRRRSRCRPGRRCRPGGRAARHRTPATASWPRPARSRSPPSSRRPPTVSLRRISAIRTSRPRPATEERCAAGLVPRWAPRRSRHRLPTRLPGSPATTIRAQSAGPPSAGVRPCRRRPVRSRRGRRSSGPARGPGTSGSRRCRAGGASERHLGRCAVPAWPRSR